MKTRSLLLAIAIVIIAKSSIAQPIKKINADKRVDNLGKSDQINGPLTFTDSRDGKTYKIVKIGTQVWMAENLAYKAKAECWAYDNDENNVGRYGYLYTWDSAKTACPPGWHLPSEAEWITLVTYLGGDSVAGKKLKETGTTHWLSPNAGASNSAGFRALPGGYSLNGTPGNGPYYFDNLGVRGYWWTSTQELVTTWAKREVSIDYDNSSIRRGGLGAGYGFSVRCVKNQGIY